MRIKNNFGTMVTISKLFQITSPWENWEMKCQSRAEQIFISKTNVLSKKIPRQTMQEPHENHSGGNERFCH